MNNAFDSPRRRLARAKEHINDFYARSEAFWDEYPPKIIPEMNSERTREEAYITFPGTLPAEMGDIAADSIENLRSALDQTGYAAAKLNGVAHPESAYFPICKGSAADLENLIKGRCKDLPDEIKALFRAFKAHHGGNHKLWALNRLSSISKHRLLIPTGMWAGLHIFKGAIKNGGIYDKLVWDRAKNRMPVFWLVPGGVFHYQSKLTYAIAFDEVEATGNGPALAILNAIAGEVESVISATEAECRRIGLMT